MIKQYTKNEYYRSKNLPFPKACHRLPIQPPVRQHLLDPIPSIRSDVQKSLQNRALQNQINLQIIQYQKVVHDLEIENQTLRLNMGQKQQQLLRRKNQRQGNQRRINFLEKQIFSLQNHIQKIQYESKANLEMATREFDLSKNNYQIKANQFDIQMSKIKMQYQEQMVSANNNYEKRLSSYESDKGHLKQISDQNVQILRKQIQAYFIQNKRIKNNLIIIEKEHIQKSKFLEEQNFILKDKLTNIKSQADLQLVKFNIQLQSKEIRINQLQIQYQKAVQIFQSQKQKWNYEKDYISKAKSQNQQMWKSKFDLSQQNCAINALNLVQTSKKLSQAQQQTQILTNKIQFLQQQVNIQKNKIRQAQDQHQTKLLKLQMMSCETKQREIQLIKGILRKKIQNLQLQNNEKQNELKKVQKINDCLKKQLEESKYQRLNLERKEREKDIILQNITYQKDKAQLTISYLKQKIQTINQEQQHQKKRLLQTFNTQKQNKIRDFVQQSNQTIQTLIVKNKSQIMRMEHEHSQFVKQSKQKQEQLISQLNVYQCKIIELNKDIEVGNQKFLSSSNLQNQQKEEYELKIQQFQQSNLSLHSQIRIANQKIFKLQSKILSLNGQVQNFNSIIKNYEQRQKNLKDKLKEQDNLRIVQIRKWSDKLQQYLSNLKKQEESKIQIIKVCKKYEAQTIHLRLKNQNYEQQIASISKQRQMYVTEASKLKNTLIHSQKSSDNLLNQINYNYNEIVGKLQSELKDKIQNLNQKNQNFANQLITLQFQNQDILNQKVQLTTLKDRLYAQIKQQNTEKQKIQQKLFISQQSLRKLQNLLIQKDSRIQNLAHSLIELESQKNIVNQRLKIHEQNLKKMKKSVIIQTDQANNQKHKSKEMQLKFIVLQQQFKETQNKKSVLQKKYHQLEVSFELISNQNYQLKEQIQIIGKRQKCIQINYQSKIAQLQIILQQKKKQFDQKVSGWDKNILFKQKQVQNLLNRLSQSNLQGQKQIQKRQRIIKGKSDQINYLLSQIQVLKADFDAYTRELESRIEQKDQQIKKIQKNRMKQSSIFQDLQAKNSQFQVRNNLLSQKLQIQISKYEKLKQKLNQTDMKCNLLEEQKQNCRSQLEVLKRKVQKCEYQQVRKAQLFEQQMKRTTQQLQSENAKIFKQEKLKYETKMTELRLQFQDQTKIKNNLKSDLANLKKNEASMKYNYESQIVNLQKKLSILNRKVIYYMQFKRRWDRLSGEVRQYNNLDHDQSMYQENLPFASSKNTQKNSQSYNADERVIQQTESQNGQINRCSYSYNYDFNFSTQIKSPNIIVQDQTKKQSPQKNFKKNQKQTPQTKETKPKQQQTEQFSQKNSDKSFKYVSQKDLLKHNYEHLYTSQQVQDNRRIYQLQKYLEGQKSQGEKQANKPRFTDQELKKIHNMRYNESDDDIQYPQPLGEMSFKQEDRVTNKKLITKIVNGEKVKKFFWTAYELEPTIKSSWISSTEWDRQKQQFDCRNIEIKTKSKIKSVMSQQNSNQNSKNSNSIQ